MTKKTDSQAIEVVSNDKVQAPARATVETETHEVNGTVVTTFVGVQPRTGGN